MIFVISYDRKKSTTTSIDRFSDEQMDEAQNRRYDLEISAATSSQGAMPEIVVLKASSEADLHESYAKYFGRAALRESIARLTK